MKRAEATEQVKKLLPNYLESQGIDIRKNFHCLSGEHDDNKPSMGYRADGNSGYPYVHCFSCGATYDTISLIAKEYGLTSYSRENFEKAYEIFGLEVEGIDQKSGPIIPVNRVPQERKIAEPVDVGNNDFTVEIENAHRSMLVNREARKHFAARHYSSDVVREYRLGFVEKGHNELLKTILPKHICKSRKAVLYQYVYPILDENGKATYFITEINDRTQCDDYNPKYRKINDLPAPLFNERYLKKDVPPVIFVTEGIPDALSVETVNGKAIALTGVGYTRLIELLAFYKPNTVLVLALDNDKAGKAMTEKLAKELDKLNVKYIISGPTFKKDYNEELIFDAKLFAESIRKAQIKALAKKNIVQPRKETAIMAKNVSFRQIKSGDPTPDIKENNKPHFKDRTKQMLVDMYLDALKKDEIPWQRGWEHLGEQRNMVSGRKYRGKNALLLSLVCDIKNYADNRWMTFNEITKYREKNNISGGYFKADAKGQSVPITYYGARFWNPETNQYGKGMTFEKAKALIEAGEEKKENMKIAVLGTYNLFNCSLVNGVEPPTPAQSKKLEHSEYITAIINALGVNYKEEGNRAYYRPATDEVVLPPSEMFKSEQAYYATQLHELSHSTGHPKRLNRDIKNMFGSEAYALEELNAEIASSFLCADLKLEETIPEFEELPDASLNHAAYVQNWIQVLENNPEKLFEAITTAQGIEDYILKEANIDIEKLNELENAAEISSEECEEDEEIDL